jgi:hypothetical protein
MSVVAIMKLLPLQSAADLSYVMYQITVSIMIGHRLYVCNCSGHLKQIILLKI